jgi:hypothetical protein
VEALFFLKFYFMRIDKLTKKELLELKGGATVSGSISGVASYAKGDVLNKNVVNGCICVYDNSNKVSNLNNVVQCTCSCQMTSASANSLAPAVRVPSASLISSNNLK